MLTLIYAPSTRLVEAEALAGTLRAAGGRAQVRALELLTPHQAEACDRLLVLGAREALEQVAAIYPGVPMDWEDASELEIEPKAPVKPYRKNSRGQPIPPNPLGKGGAT